MEYICTPKNYTSSINHTSITNQTSNVTENNDENEYDQSMDHFNEWVYQIIFPFLLALGILSNIINILVLHSLNTKKKLKSFRQKSHTLIHQNKLTLKKKQNLVMKTTETVKTTHNYLIILAITQMMTCIGLCVSIAKFDRSLLPYGWAFYYAHFDSPIVNCLTSSSAYIIVGISIDRFTVLCFHSFYMKKIKPNIGNVVKARIYLSLIVPVLIYIPKLFAETVVCSDNGMGWTYRRKTEMEWLWFYFLFAELCHRIFPSAIIIVANICISIGFRKQTTNRQKIFKRQTSLKETKQEKFLQFLLVTIVIAFLVSTLPAAVLIMMDFAGMSKDTFRFKVFRGIANILELLGNSVNFLLYCCLMPKVREMIKKKLGILAPTGANARNIVLMSTTILGVKQQQQQQQQQQQPTKDNTVLYTSVQSTSV